MMSKKISAKPTNKLTKSPAPLKSAEVSVIEFIFTIHTAKTTVKIPINFFFSYFDMEFFINKSKAIT